MHKCFYLPVSFVWILICDLKSIDYFEADYQMLQVTPILGKSRIPNIVVMKKPFVRLFAVSTLASSNWSDSPNTESPYSPLCHWTQKMAQVWAAPREHAGLEVGVRCDASENSLPLDVWSYYCLLMVDVHY